MRRALVGLVVVGGLAGFGLLTHQLRQPAPTGAALGLAELPQGLVFAEPLDPPAGVIEGRFAALGPEGWEIVDAPDADAVFRQLPDAIEVEPLLRVRASGAPNDPRYPYQWNLQGLDMPAAWDSSQGEGAVIAVLDTGVSEKLDGFAPLLEGYDITRDRPGAPDDGWHGTHVAGVVAQATNNGEGVAGIAPRATILPVKVLDAKGGGNSVHLAEGIRWAVDNGADIINLSLGLDQPSSPVEQACDYARDNGVLVVAATGNDGLRQVQYPAAYEGVIAVAAVDLNYEVTDYSNVGPSVDLVAPGGDLGADLDGDGLVDGIMQAAKLNGEWQYVLAEGTSVATPHVSGTAALLFANGVTDPERIRDQLLGTAEDLGDAGHDPMTGWGLLDPVSALSTTTASVDEGDRYDGSWSTTPTTNEGTQPLDSAPRGCSTR